MLSGDFIKELAQRLEKPPTISTPHGTMYLDHGEYRPAHEKLFRPMVAHSISSLHSFAETIRDEARRGFADLLVTVTRDGGELLTERDFDGGLQYRYTRRYHPAFDKVLQYSDERLSHEEIFELIQNLKPYINNYKALYAAYRELKVTGTFKNTSAVAFGDDDKLGETQQFEYQIKGGKSQAVLPKKWKLKLPLVVGGIEKVPGDEETEIELDISVELRKVDEETKKPVFVIRFYKKDEILMAQTVAEMKFLKEKLSDLTKERGVVEKPEDMGTTGTEIQIAQAQPTVLIVQDY